MTNRAVTTRAFQPTRATVIGTGVDGRGDVLVTAPARVLRHLVIESGDLDGIGILAASEVERMPETIVGFYRILADQVVRCVAIIAAGRMAMA